MAIRFQCAACSEPIEVDDQWARQVVRCPYCQRTVTAPAESTLPAIDQIPVANAVTTQKPVGPVGNVGPIGALPPQPPPPTATNRSAVAALILAFLAVGFLFLAISTLSNHKLEMGELSERITEAGKSGKSPMSAVMDYMESQGGQMPGWLATFVMFEFASLGAWLAAIVFGIIGLFRPVRRGMAALALIICGGLCVLFCMSAVVGGLGG